MNIHNFFEKLSKKSLLMLDYDGTLAPLVKERDHAYPYPGIKDRLIELLKLKTTRTVIISGRSLSELEKLLDFPKGLELWGSHGLERKMLDGRIISAPINSKLRRGLEEGKQACLKHATPDHCEIKPYGVALHWRGMDPTKKKQMATPIEHLWKQIASFYELNFLRFDGGFELRLPDKNKGDAVKALLNEMPKDAAIAYLGDDLTDEEAFAELGDRGLKVLIRKQLRPTSADIHLIPPNELLTFLDQWILISKEGQDGRQS